MMKLVIVTGGRDYENKDVVFSALDKMKPDWVVTGSCRTGADRLAEQWSKSREVNYTGYPAKWGRWKSAAGPIRNGEILESEIRLRGSKDIVVLAFPGGKGTRNMCEQASSLGIEVVYAVNNEAQKA